MKKILSLLVLTILAVALFAFLFLYAKKDTEKDMPVEDLVERVDSVKSGSNSVIEQIVESVSAIPQIIREEVAAPIVDTLVNKVLSVDDMGDAKAFHQKSKTLPIQVTNINVADGALSFNVSLQTNHYGKVDGTVEMQGAQIDWPGRLGILSDIKGRAVANVRKNEEDSLSVGINKLNELIPYLPKQSVSVSEETPVQGALCLDNAGKFVMVKADSMSTLAQMKALLKEKDINYAIFVKGHVSYNGSVGREGITLDFISHESEEKPKGYSQKIW